MRLQLLLLISFLALLSPIASWGPPCASLEIQTKQITGLPVGSNFDHTYFTVPLSQTQTNLTYQVQVSFAQVFLSQFDTQLRLAIGASAKNASFIQILVVGTYSGKYLTLVKVKYLVIPAHYSTLITTLLVVSDYLNQTLAPQGSLEIYRTLPITLGSPDFLYTSYLSNIDMQTTSPQLEFSIDYSLTLLNVTSYKIAIRNLAQSSITYYFLDRVIVIAYHTRFPAGTSVSFSYMTYPILSTSDALVQAKNTLLGLVSFSARNGTAFSWSVAPQQAQVSMGVNSTRTSWLIFTFHIFSNGQCCGFTPYIDIVNKQCRSSCPANTTTVQSCYLCQKNSKFNTQTKVCEACPSQSVLNHSTGTCLPCPANTFLDSSSNTCRPCPSSTFLNSQFFCEPCPDNSFFNQTSNACESCGFLLLNRTSGACEKCRSGYYLNMLTLTCQTLDNSSQNSSCNGGRTLHYTLLIESVARKFVTDVMISPETCQARVIFNGQSLGSISPANFAPMRSLFPVRLIQGDNTLLIEGTSYEDGLGLIVGKVKLYSAYNNTDLIVNGDFSSTISNLSGSYPGWSCPKAEVGLCTAYNDEWTSFNYTNTSKCIELQSDSNQNYTQIIKVPVSLRCSLLNQAQQAIQTTVNTSTQADSIRYSLPTPLRTYFSETTFHYESCPFDCQFCSDNGSLCTACNSTSDFRTLNPQTNRCDPLPGYSNDGNSTITRRCADSSCVSCYYLYQVCLDCAPNTTLFNNTCVSCNVDNCVQCRSTNRCLACATGYSLMDNRCLSCSMQDCLFCGENSKCSLCAGGRQLLNNSCISCNVSNCLHCSSPGKCDTCGGNYTLNSLFVCVFCNISACAKCDSSNACLSCIDNATLINNTCICKDGYGLQQGICIQLNKSSLAAEDSPANSLKYIGIGSVIGLTASLLALAIFILIKKTNSAAVSITSLETNETKINQSDEIRHVENSQTHQQFKKNKREKAPKDKELKIEQFEHL